MESIKTFISGMLLGISNAIPGVSGGTMAVILNIYDKLLEALSPRTFKQHRSFLLPLLMGMICGIFGLSKVIVPLQVNFPVPMGFAFMGLIIGSLPVIGRHAFNDGIKPKSYNIALCVFCFALMIALSHLESAIVQGNTIEEMGGFNAPIVFFLVVSTSVAAIATIIPGISGSLILLIFGTYTGIMEAIADLNFGIMIPVVIGTIMGLGLGVSGIKKAMTYFPQAMYFAILGLVAGSLWPVYPGFTHDRQGVIAIICLIAGAIIAYQLSKPRNL